MNFQTFKIILSKWASQKIIPAIAPEGPLRWLFAFAGMNKIMPLIDQYASFLPATADGDVDMDALEAALNNALEDKLLPKETNLVTEEFAEETDVESLSQKVYEYVLENYENKVNEVKKLGFDFSILERNTLLRVVDKFWTDHIDSMNILRNEIGVLGYGQKDPVVAYKNEGFDMFDKMIDEIREYTASTLYRAKIRIDIQPTAPKGPVAMGNVNKVERTQAKSSSHIGRNDLCPCGSGKKYKNCCMLKDNK